MFEKIKNRKLFKVGLVRRYSLRFLVIGLLFLLAGCARINGELIAEKEMTQIASDVEKAPKAKPFREGFLSSNLLVTCRQ